MSETGHALRATSDALLRDLETLSSLEEEKRQVVPGDPRLVDLASQIEDIATRLLKTSTHERKLTEVIQTQREMGSPAAPMKPIEQTPRPISAVLSDWRDAERRFNASSPGSAARREAELLIDSLREEYRRAYDEARHEKRS